MLIPFTGFPEIIRDSLIVLSGFLIALFGFYHGSDNYALVEESLVVNLETDARALPEVEKKVKAHHRAKKEDHTNDESTSTG